jgi:hypothetical protein
MKTQTQADTATRARISSAFNAWQTCGIRRVDERHRARDLEAIASLPTDAVERVLKRLASEPMLQIEHAVRTELSR